MSNNWKKKRNYRKVRLSDDTTKNIITVDDQDVEVTDEVFKAYSQMDRRERYQEELDSKETFLSLEKLSEDEVSLDMRMFGLCLSAEDEYIESISAAEKDRIKIALKDALKTLTKNEQSMIQAIYFDGISAREYARRSGVYPRAVMYRLEQLQEKLRKKIFF